MKKIMLTAALIAAASFLTSCNADGFDVSSEIDTNLQLDTPSVKVSAWPGMNYVSWKPVSNANGYVVYIYEDGHHISTNSLAYDVLNYKDTDIRNGSKYEYLVEAESKTSTGRSVVTQNSKCGSDSCTAIVPDYNVKSLELNNHEKGIGKKGDAKYLLSESNIHVAVDNFDTFSISFPTKAYLQYAVYFTGNNEFESIGYKDVAKNNMIGSQLYADNASNNRIYTIGKRPVTKSGVYRIGVIAASENEHYGISDPVISSETVTIEALPGKVPAITSAAYCNANTVRVVFPKFALEGSDVAPESYYKVYRSYKDSYYNYTPVTGTVKFTNSAKTALYVEDTVTDNTKTLVYTLVITDGKRYASTCQTKDVDPFALGDQAKTTVSGSPTTEENDATANDITWTITKAATDVEITGIKILEVPATDADSHTVVAADFTKEIALSELNWTTNVDSKTYNVYTKDHTVGTKVYMLVTTSQFNKKDAEWISTGVEIKAPVVSKTNLKIDAYVLNSADYFGNISTEKPKDIVVGISDKYTVATDSYNNYTYALYMAKTEIKEDKVNHTITYRYGTNWTKVKDITLDEYNVYDTEATTKEYTTRYTELKNQPDGVYSFRVIKKSKATGEEVSSTIATAQIDTSSSIVYVPGKEDGITGEIQPDITASWNNATGATDTINIRFTKDNTKNTKIYDEKKDQSHQYPIGINAETQESGVGYTVYRATIYEQTSTTGHIDPVEHVFEYVGEISAQPAQNINKASYDRWSWDGNTPNNEGSTDYVTSIDFATTDKDRSTKYSYLYIVVATKTGCASRFSNIAEVVGAN